MSTRNTSTYLGWIFGLFCLLLNSVVLSAQTLEYSIRWDTKDDRYHVFMKPNATPVSKDMSMTGQFTIRVPHATGADAFTVHDPRITVTNTIWSNDSRVNAPSEDRSVDYLSFSLNMIKSDAFQWKAGEEKEVFSFGNSGKCIGAIALIDNETDPFNAPLLKGSYNSAGTDPKNQFTNLGWGGTDENNYLGNYGSNNADCHDSIDTDGDGLKNGDEIVLGTNPHNPDTDGDGYSDGDEVHVYGTDPLLMPVRAGVEYRVGWSALDQRYHVYMRPTTTPSKDLSIVGQVTLLVPHAIGDQKFTVSDIKTKAGTNWSLSSEVYAPSENKTIDYLSFNFTPIDVRASAIPAIHR